jgi:phenylpropionate dioxygenase-like ring-hydroxylating dioxygenase large terminal subunit
MFAEAETIDMEKAPLRTPKYPELGTGPLLVEPYVSPSYFEREREAVFRNAWMLACHESELTRPGDFVVKTVGVLRASIIVVKGRDGVIRGFHNVCRHRGNQLVNGPCRGHAKAGFVCGFHSWMFDTSGKLRGVPDSSRFFDLKKDELGLIPAAVEVFNSFVFFSTQAQPRQGLREYLGAMAEPLGRYKFDSLRLAAEWRSEVNTNWKIFMDAFQEGYHVRTVHKTTAPSGYTGKSNPFVRHSFFKPYGRHRQMTVPLDPAFEKSPTEQFTADIMQKIVAAAMASNGGAMPPLPPGCNPGGEPHFGFDINGIFPSALIDAALGMCFTMEFAPQALDKTQYLTKLYFDPPVSNSQRIAQELLLIQLREALLEDFTTLESTYRGMSSGAIQSVILSDSELGPRHAYWAVDSLVRGHA